MIRAPRELGASIAALAAGVLYVAAQPDRGLWPAAFVCLVPLYLAMAGRSFRFRLWTCLAMANCTALLGTAGAASEGIGAYFGLSPALALLGWLGLAQVIGTLPMLLFVLLAGDPGRGPAAGAVLRVACAWMAAELLRSVFLSGMPWFLLAYALVEVPVFVQAASLGGVLLVSGQLALVNAAIARIARDRRIPPSLVAVLAATVLVTALPALEPEAGPPSYGVLLVQGPIGGEAPRTPASAPDEIRRLAALSAGAAQVDLVVWAENAVNLIQPWNEALLRGSLLDAVVRAPHLLIGAPVDAGQGDIHTSALLLSAQREVLNRHDKVKLVPFGEYTPWPLPGADAPRQTRPGARPGTLDVAGTRVGPLICYEVLFPGLARAHVDAGAQLLANLSNDGWFRHPAALEQHLAAAVFRAVETRRPMLRATRTGITAAIDARGRLLGRLPVGEEAALAVQVAPDARRSAFVAGGYWLPWAVAVGSVLCAWRRRAGG